MLVKMLHHMVGEGINWLPGDIVEVSDDLGGRMVAPPDGSAPLARKAPADSEPDHTAADYNRAVEQSNLRAEKDRERAVAKKKRGRARAPRG